MACNSSCPYFHYVTSVAISSGKLVLTFSDAPTGITDTTRFCFRFNCNITPPTGYASLPVYASINGTLVPMWNKYGDIMTGADFVLTTTGYFCPRYTYHGYVGAQTTTSNDTQVTTLHVICNNAPKNTCHVV